MAFIKQPKTILRTGASLLALMALGACGGSDSGSTIAPPPTTQTPPPPPAPVGKTVVGPISGFGSVIVNGVRYETNNASFTIDGNPGSQADLKVGQIVVLKSERDSSGANIASSVDYEEILEGPVESIDLVNDRFVILGRTVVVNNTTSFDDDISPSSIDGIVVGDILEISGDFNADGEIIATRVEKSDDQSANNDFEIHGTVEDLDTTAMTFRLGTLTIGYSSAVLEDFDDSSIANGDFVEVEGTTFLNDGTFIATKVENQNDDRDEFRGDEDDEAEIKGLITTFESAERFTIAGVTILTNASTEFEDGGASDLGLNVRVEVEGTFNAAGELVAETIEFELISDIEISSTIDAIDTTNNTITVFGVVFAVDEKTRYEDNSSGASQTFSIANLAVGDFVEVSGYQNADGGLIASTVEREDEDDQDEAEISGPIDSVSTDSFVILGITVQTNGQTQYENEDGNALSAGEFFDQIAQGVIVEVEGVRLNGTTLLAEEIEIDD